MFNKAFDMVPHWKSVNWEKMRISTRTAKVREELVEEALAGDVQQEKLLDWREVTHGSSQGCILRLILLE